MINVVERGYRDTAIGRVMQLKIYAEDLAPLCWGKVWGAYTKRYPDKWALQMFPPSDRLVDVKNVYHLWVCDSCPDGLDLR